MKSMFALIALVALTSVAHAQRGPGGPGPGHGPGPGPGHHNPGGPMIHPPAPPEMRSGDREIYEALNVREGRVARVGATTFEKNVGGLSCSMVVGVGPRRGMPKYDCDLSNRRRNDEAIYQALNVRPVRVDRTRVGAAIDQKSVGGLTCRSSRPVVPRAVARYECNLRSR